jgi:hypothetical protein
MYVCLKSLLGIWFEVRQELIYWVCSKSPEEEKSSRLREEKGPYYICIQRWLGGCGWRMSIPSLKQASSHSFQGGTDHSHIQEEDSVWSHLIVFVYKKQRVLADIWCLVNGRRKQLGLRKGRRTADTGAADF